MNQRKKKRTEWAVIQKSHTCQSSRNRFAESFSDLILVASVFVLCASFKVHLGLLFGCGTTIFRILLPMTPVFADILVLLYVNAVHMWFFMIHLYEFDVAGPFCQDSHFNDTFLIAIAWRNCHTHTKETHTSTHSQWETISLAAIQKHKMLLNASSFSLSSSGLAYTDDSDDHPSFEWSERLDRRRGMRVTGRHWKHWLNEQVCNKITDFGSHFLVLFMLLWTHPTKYKHRQIDTNLLASSSRILCCWFLEWSSLISFLNWTDCNTCHHEAYVHQQAAWFDRLSIYTE